ncbi:SMC family ATPase [Paenibacillus sp. J5C_2022]|uniref:AAA family ATPase n=1 Tax=Paenibacillus sp. J5C2022 TaxID=2977129 RepID=UPI0021CE978E|nr:SMC family ATPase [Paenibacillus sp. J5C2022]MCU6710382.1 SMC family ATPase [Paenibacillus sp. J5C2022]
MRPLRLTMTAFGPYRDSETVDFTQLENHRLFVISGNTGAGKTSIFDAVCFALYGSASGEDRSDVRMLRSHFADEETHTSVELDFVIRDKRYRVFRQMKHRKSGNRSETGEKTELYEIVGDEAVPATDRFMATEVNARLQAVIGLTKEQFSQIVMLPQGEFRKLLTSDTDNKEDILRRIFRTELYERLERRFHGEVRSLQDTLKEERAGVDALMRQAEEALPAREDSSLHETFRQDVYSAAQVKEGLRREAEHYRAEAAVASRRKKELGERLDERQLRLQAALELNRRHDDWAIKQEEQRRLLERKPDVEQQERELELARRAAGLAPYEEQARRAEESSRMKREEHARSLKQWQEAERALEAATARYRREAEREEIRQEARLAVHRLSELLPAVDSLADQQRELEQLQRKERETAAELATAEGAYRAGKEKHATLQGAIRGLEASVAKLPETVQQLRQVELQGKEVKRQLQLAEELSRHDEMESKSARQLDELRSQYGELERRWIEGQAGLLASHLHDGKPCPVCGSESHPGKAELQTDMPSKESLQEAKEYLSAVERELLAVKAQAAAALQQQEAGMAELAEYGMESLSGGDAAGLMSRLQEAQGGLRAQWRTLKAETDAMQGDAARLEEQRASLLQLEAELVRLEGARETLQGDGQQLMLQRAGAESALAKELDRIPEELRSPEQLRLQLRKRQAEASAMEQAWKEAQEAMQRMSTRGAELKAYSEQADLSQKAAAKDAEEYRALMADKLMLAGFTSLDEYRAAVKSEEGMTAMQAGIESYRSAVHALESAQAALRQELHDKPRIDPEPLREEIAACKREHEAAIAGEGAALRYERDAVRLEAAIGARAGKAAELESKLESVLDIYAMLKGDNALKMSFERYILIEYLEQILAMANERLKGLSGGQFQLVRSDRLEARGKQSGLGLDVYDAYTGQNRDVKTLSGGEKFNASLCLALGMSDVIQSHQGGVSIEMMFIDEGFGSLDEESLHNAIAALVDLQRAGRMIGVISHVGDLKEAFPACLEVTKSREGFSRTEIVLRQ